MDKEEIIGATISDLDVFNQEDIAQKLGLSRQKVSRLLIEARVQGIVRISIYDPDPPDPNLRDQLISRFGLRDVILASSEKLESDQLRSAIGLVAAEHLLKVIRDDQTVGIGWGRTLFEVINLLHEGGNRHINVVPLIGARPLGGSFVLPPSLPGCSPRPPPG